jgi:hypothetical protein
MQERVERSRADTIPMMCQFLHHGQSEDWLLGSVYEHVNANESREQIPLMPLHKVNIRDR